MKLTKSTKTTVASQGVKGSSGFSIATSAHMFNILSDGLYSDKIGAVLREIGANAMDAHIMAAKPDLPFEVKLPSRLDSTFHIKDFGPGLDDQEVRELYTTYGWSSKQSSNEVTGAFGLGSKSPFAYTDAFSICAVKDGVKRVYTAHKDDEGKPVVSLLNESPADANWQAGVMVTFPVPPEDVDEFVSKAGSIFRWFRVKPHVLGAKISLEDPEFKTRGSAFALGAQDRQDAMPRVVMANVAYPLSGSRLDNVDELAQALLNCDVHLFLKTGSVMPTPNREDIQYDKQSRPAIAQALREAATEVAREIYTRVNEQKTTPWMWHRRIREYAESLPYSVKGRAAQFLELVTTDKGELKTLQSLFNKDHEPMPGWVGDGRDAALAPDASKLDRRGCRVWFYWLDKSSKGQVPVKRKEVIRGHVRYASSQEPSQLVLSYTDNVTVMVADAGRADLRVKYLLDETGKEDHKVILVQPVRGADKEFAQEYAKELAGTERGLGGLPVKNVADIELPSHVADRAKSAKLTLDERREAFKDEELCYFSLTDPTQTVQSLSFGDVDDELDKFYVNVRESRGHKSYFNTLDDGSVLSFTMEDLKRVVRSLAELRKVEGRDGMTGFFVVRGETVKSLKLLDDGWKPALPELQKMAKDGAWAEKLSKHVDTSPELRLNDEWYSRRAGFPGLLAYHCKKATPFFGQVKKLMGDHPLVLLANRLAAKSQLDQGRRQDTRVEQLISVLNSRGGHTLSMSLPGLARMSECDVSNLTYSVYSSLRMLSFEAWAAVCNSEPELAASLLWQFVHLKSNADPAEAKQLHEIAA